MPRLTFCALTTLALTTLALGACSSGGTSSTGTTTGAQPPVITISGMNWGPSNLTVAAGTTITIINNDTASPHTMTSEAVAGAYDAGVALGGFAFNTRLIAQDGGMATIQVPSTIASGTVMPYFCEVHLATMNPPNPTITIQ